MNLSTPFETERLKFRLLRMSDLNVVHRQFSDPDMYRYFCEPPVSWDEAAGIIEQFQNPERDGYLRYGMFRRDTGEFVGTCGYHHWDRETRQVELGYDIWKEFWRQGYATEALKPLIDTCFQNLDVEQVYVLIHPENVASISTASKVGFVESQPCRPLDEESQVCMKLTRGAWRASDALSNVERRDGEATNGI